MIIISNRLLVSSLGPFLVVGCIRNDYRNSTGDSASSLQSLPGVASEVAEKKPKYKLYCASELAELKSPTTTQLVREFSTLETDKPLDIPDSSKITDSTYCLLDVVISDPSHESLFKWLSKDASGSPIKGVFYRSDAVKPSSKKLNFILYRTHELANSGTLDLAVTTTFPADIKASESKDPTLTCGTSTYRAIATTPDPSESTLTKILVSLPKTTFSDKTTICSFRVSIGIDTYGADNVKIEPKSADSKIDVAISMTKQVLDPKTMIIQTTIK